MLHGFTFILRGVAFLDSGFRGAKPRTPPRRGALGKNFFERKYEKYMKQALKALPNIIEQPLIYQ